MTLVLTPEQMKRREAKFYQETFDHLQKKYRETGDKKYVMIAHKLGFDIDICDFDWGNEPNNNQE